MRFPKNNKYRYLFFIIVIGIVSAVCVHVSSLRKGRLVEGTHLLRNEWGEGNYTVILRGITETTEGEITYEIKERILSGEERLALKEQLLNELPQIIAGENENLMMVKRDLNLVTRVEGYPFSLVWQSSDHNRVRSDGKVNTANIPTDGEMITLRVTGTYEDERWEEKIPVKLLPVTLTPREQYLAAMQEELFENDLLYREKSKVVLPEKIGEEAVIWEEKKKDYSYIPLLLCALCASCVPVLQKRKRKAEREKRSRELNRCYPEFVLRLGLYIGAGLNVKNAFLRMGNEYQEQKRRTGKVQLLYEEIQVCNNGFLNGMPESEVYREWGKRCGEMKYRKLAFLLISHLRQGNEKILSLLSDETDAALEERRNLARKKGEEAGTKLLFPMMLMLVVVMFLILLPAFSGFGA